MATNYQVEETYYVEHQTAFGAMLWVIENCGYDHDSDIIFNIDIFFQLMPSSGRYICAEYHAPSNRWKVEVTKVDRS